MNKSKIIKKNLAAKFSNCFRTIGRYSSLEHLTSKSAASLTLGQYNEGVGK